MSDLKIIHAYRHLYRGLLHAVQFAKPARYIARLQLRKAFTEEGAQYDPRGIARTKRFLEAAARERGLEHMLLKNLLVIAKQRFAPGTTYYQLQANQKWGKSKTPLEVQMTATAYAHYDRTIAMLNKSMGLCLR
ncbi:DUF1763-domain-containing protein [Xylariaceae sp. FL0255]|nr:DUF1763-domain-containing protein [Xylariaceae sp. FL0255]